MQNDNRRPAGYAYRARPASVPPRVMSDIRPVRISRPVALVAPAVPVLAETAPAAVHSTATGSPQPMMLRIDNGRDNASTKRLVPSGWLQRVRTGSRRVWRTQRDILRRRLKSPRWLAATGLVAILLVSIALPLAQEYIQQREYKVDAATARLVGSESPNLARKFAYDPAHSRWQFNKDGIKPEASAKPGDGASGAAAAIANVQAEMKAQAGGEGKKDASLYSVNLPTDGKKGVQYYDNNTNLSFTLEPVFKVGTGRLQDGRLIYPFQDGGKLVYTAKSNGMKEDIVLPKNIGSELHFEYKLNLPDALEARVQADGSVGIFSADPSLFGNVSYGSDSDRQAVEKARQTAEKNHLLFALPAPVIKQSGAGGHQAKASFQLDGDSLNVDASGLDQLAYPVSIDPSVVITSSSDFGAGNNEGMIEYPSGQINRGGLTGGSAMGTWSTGTNFTTGRFGHQSVTYNGYMYVIGGYDGGSTYLNDVQYAQLNANGSVGTWAATTSFTTGRQYHSTVAYNGYMYVMAGWNGTTYYNDVQYAAINANGTLGSWQATTSVPTARRGQTAAVYNGYIYVIGGYSSSSAFLNDVQYAPLNADGTVGAWASTSAFTNGRNSHTTVVYNGYLYVMGGYPNGYTADVQYAPINGDGTVGAWKTTTSLPGTFANQGAAVYNGYVYVSGGTNNGSTLLKSVYYAQLNANGTIGTWQQTADMPNMLYIHEMTAYNGYLYIAGGLGAGYYNTTIYNKIDAPGTTLDYGTTRSLPAPRFAAQTVAYNNYIYVLGGAASYAGGPLTSVYKAAINANGTLGTWATTTAFTTKRVYFYAAAYNGYMYVVGGGINNSGTATNTVYKAPINANGTLGTWAATSSFATPRAFLGGAIYNSYMYIVGGINNSSTVLSDVQYAAINSDGTLGAWAATSGITNAREDHKVVAYGGYLYVVGGDDNSSTVYSDVQYAAINSNGTLGTFGTTSSLVTARYNMGLVAANGYLYVIGGEDMSTTYTTVEYAAINSNGTLGAWTANTDSAIVLTDASYLYCNGYIYIVGGIDNSSGFTPVVNYTSINNGGSGTAGTWINSTNTLPTARAGVATVAYNGYLYVIGGTNSGTYYNQMVYAKLNNDGTVGAWTTDMHTFTNGRARLNAAVYNGYLYVVGGWNGTNYYKDVQYAPIGSSGGLSGNFASTTDFAAAGRAGAGVGVYKGYMYVVGGYDGTTNQADTRYAAINADGTVGAWAASSSFTGGRSDQAVTINNGYIYLAGGSGASITNDVQYAPLNSDGTVGAWKATSGFNGVREFAYMGAYNGFMYLVGGQSTGTANTGDTAVQYAVINTNGTLSAWQHTTALLLGISKQGGAIYNGYIYRVAGEENGTGANSNIASYAPLNVIAREGLYSKLFDLGIAADYNVNTVSYNGTLPWGQAAISLRSAGSNGVFGASRSALSLTNGTVDCTVSTAGRYAWLSIMLDDSQSASFPDSAATPANLTDVTVSYNVLHPKPQYRLRDGKFFDKQALQPMDVCSRP